MGNQAHEVTAPNRFKVLGKLPSLNEYTKACRGQNGWVAGAKMKERVEADICWCIKSAMSWKELRKVTVPVVIHFEWHERTKRRDLDNIRFAAKFLLDALQKMGVLPNDNPQWVRGLSDTVVYDKWDGVIVTIEPAEVQDGR